MRNNIRRGHDARNRRRTTALHNLRMAQFKNSKHGDVPELEEAWRGRVDREISVLESRLQTRTYQ